MIFDNPTIKKSVETNSTEALQAIKIDFARKETPVKNRDNIMNQLEYNF